MDKNPFELKIDPERQQLADKGPLYMWLLTTRTPAQVKTLIEEMTKQDNYPLDELEFLGQKCPMVIRDMENIKELTTELLTRDTGVDDHRGLTTEEQKFEHDKINNAVISFCKYRLKKMGANPIIGNAEEVTDMVNGLYSLGQKYENQ